MKTSFKFTQADWTSFAFFAFFHIILYNVLRSYFDIGMAMLIGFGVGVSLQFFFRKYFISVVEFKETFLQLEKGLNNQKVEIQYSEISKISFSYNRFLNLQIVTLSGKIELPPPARLEKAEELFQWLVTKNPAIEMEVRR